MIGKALSNPTPMNAIAREYQKMTCDSVLKYVIAKVKDAKM